MDIYILNPKIEVDDSNDFPFTFGDFLGSIFIWVVATQILFVWKPMGFHDSQFDEHIFQVGWFNHQLEKCLSIYIYVFPCIYILKHLELYDFFRIFTLQVTTFIVHSYSQT